MIWTMKSDGEYDRAVATIDGKTVGVTLYENGEIYLSWKKDGKWELAALPIWKFGDNPLWHEGE